MTGNCEYNRVIVDTIFSFANESCHCDNEAIHIEACFEIVMDCFAFTRKNKA
ncbi:hypothetical protein [Legionella hackeliae]|uniref:hypothetical protein n=1 Tax=Legionella hackeliae TaxID=449 RepID=UPI000A9AA661|nr:hypothetical protein [Legionella hackeliae]